MFILLKINKTILQLYSLMIYTIIVSGSEYKYINVS